MHRSTVREFVAPGTGVARGEVLVATEIGDPVRGALGCPAAPLAGGLLRGKGTPVRYAPVARCDDPGGDDRGAVLFVATCQQRDGSTAAVAAAAAPADRVAAAAARSAVGEWSAVFGTRTLLIAAGPWCSGAQRALAAARDAVANRPAVHLYGQLAADPQARSELEASGMVPARRLQDVPDGGTVLIPAHGVPPDVHAEAAGRGLKIIDASCPLVGRAQAEAARFAESGDDVVLAGQPSTPVAAAISGQAPRSAVVGTAAGTAGLQVDDPRRVSYLLQPGIPVEDWAPVIGALRSRFPALRGPHPDGFCYAASDRAESVRAVAAASDIVLVLGADQAPDSRMLCGLVRERGARAQVIGDAGGIVPALLAGMTTIGLAESNSAAPALARQVTAALAGLGPLSVVRRQVRSEVIGAEG